MKKNNNIRSTGWAHTKEYPHKRHPALFRKKSGDDIEYVTFTHSEKVDFDKYKKTLPKEKHDVVHTLKLNVNIDKSQKGDGKYSRVIPRVYDGKRSSLGKGTNGYKLDKSDHPLIDSIFKTGKRYSVPKTSNSKKKWK